MSTQYIDIRIKGKPVRVLSDCIENRTVIVRGKLIRIAAVRDEELVPGETVPDPALFISRLKDSELDADIFTFGQKIPDILPKHQYRLEWDNAAVIPITSFSEWWEKRAKYDVRKAVKRAERVGVVVKLCEFNDAFVEGICRIYSESPVRQGRPFVHYRKDFDTVKREAETYLERSAFVGAYYDDELIGFIKMVYVGPVATTLHVISQKKHYDKKPTNALIAKAVEICELEGMSHLVYGSYSYNDANSSLTEFKRRNGFENVLVPRYYVPLTLKGSVALKGNFHHRLADLIPVPVLAQLRNLRGLWYNHRLQSAKNAT